MFHALQCTVHSGPISCEWDWGIVSVLTSANPTQLKSGFELKLPFDRLSSCLRHSATIVKSVLFFFQTSFLCVGFDFGQRQNGETVNDVNLPPWCDGDPRLFVLIHRQALESPYVTSHLNHWLDLVFGYKQQGEEAVKAINVFHPSVSSTSMSSCGVIIKVINVINYKFYFLLRYIFCNKLFKITYT